jgi:hypothetical protein
LLFVTVAAKFFSNTTSSFLLGDGCLIILIVVASRIANVDLLGSKSHKIMRSLEKYRESVGDITTSCSRARQPARYFFDPVD